MKPNKSLRLVADQTRAAIDRVSAPIYAREAWPDDEFDLKGTFPLENLIGRELLELTAPSVSRVMLSAFLHEANFGSTQLVIALSAHERTSGVLPESLNELEGVWIETMPTDPFSGDPLLYSPATRLVFSVGPERKKNPASVDLTGNDIIRGFKIPKPATER